MTVLTTKRPCGPLCNRRKLKLMVVFWRNRVSSSDNNVVLARHWPEMVRDAQGCGRWNPGRAPQFLSWAPGGSVFWGIWPVSKINKGENFDLWRDLIKKSLHNQDHSAWSWRISTSQSRGQTVKHTVLEEPVDKILVLFNYSLVV